MENDYLFKKWGIKSILMNNPLTYEYNSVRPSDLTSKDIIMIGRTNDRIKRFELGIKSMKIIIKEIPKCKMNIVGSSEIYYETIIKNLNLDNYVNFTGFDTNIDKYLKTSSLHILTSFAESYSMVLSEAKIFGIPTILCGLDYLFLSKGRTILIYADNPETIAKESIKILKNDKYRKKLGSEARKSIKQVRNNLIAKKWSKLLLSIYKGNNNYLKLDSKRNRNKMSQQEAQIILNNQFKLWRNRLSILSYITLEKLKSYFY